MFAATTDLRHGFALSDGDRSKPVFKFSSNLIAAALSERTVKTGDVKQVVARYDKMQRGGRAASEPGIQVPSVLSATAHDRTGQGM